MDGTYREKILQVMCECGVIIKDGYNQEGDFTFASAFSVVTKVRDAFIKNGVIPEPELFLEQFEKSPIKLEIRHF